MKINITIDLDEILDKPVDDWDEEDEAKIDEVKTKLPKKTVKLSEDEAHVDELPNAEPLTHTVKKGETLKSICEKYGVSYGEMSNHMMDTEGTNNIFEGQKIEIPRHFVDLTEATEA